HVSDHVAALDLGAGPDAKTPEVAVAAFQTPAMADDHEASVVAVAAGEHHHPGGGGADRRAAAVGDVHALVEGGSAVDRGNPASIPGGDPALRRVSPRRCRGQG